MAMVFRVNRFVAANNKENAMGFNFRKSFKIAPGVKLNVSKKGISSISAGVKGARVNVGRKGTRTTVGLPGTGLSYTSYKSHRKSNRNYDDSDVSWSVFKIFLWSAVLLLAIIFLIF